jgi:hypothetical protein
MQPWATARTCGPRGRNVFSGTQSRNFATRLFAAPFVHARSTLRRRIRADAFDARRTPPPVTVGDSAQINAMSTGSNPMKRPLYFRRASLLNALRALAVSVFVAGAAAAATPPVDESQLLALGFKVLVATTTVQQEWVQTLPPGQMRPMQRNGKHFFIYPDAPRNRIYVGGPKEYAAYRELHPESQAGMQEAADKARAYRLKQDDAMRKATARDLSDPFLGASWADLGW